MLYYTVYEIASQPLSCFDYLSPSDYPYAVKTLFDFLINYHLLNHNVQNDVSKLFDILFSY